MSEQQEGGAWIALVEHLKQEVEEGRESFHSADLLILKSVATEVVIDIRNMLLPVLAKALINCALVELEKNKAPFWAKKWRGQR